ncbi:MAG: hypothetical protein QF654_11535 [Alphaproteobacteria bacterium]|nr:hypothetical protein [Alphaproteobacteria bacterium]
MQRTATVALQTSLLIGIIMLAFIMQVFPFLLVMTMLSMAFGVSSGVMLVIIPIVVFGMFGTACWFAETRRRKWRAPVSHLSPHDQRQDRRASKDQAMIGTHTCLLPWIRRRSFY